MYTITHGNESLFTGTLDNCLRYLTKKLGAVSVTEAVEEGYSIAGATLGRKGGKARSEAKTLACRANGKKGGRPRKVAK
jgi:hypothetical protein